MKKNVWIFNHYALEMLEQEGGRHYWLSKELKLMGYDPVVFCADKNHFNLKGEHFTPEIKKNKYEVILAKSKVEFILVRTSPYRNNSFRRVINMISFTINAYFSAIKYAKKNGEPDIIYASSVHPLTIITGIFLAKKFKIPCIGEVRDLWPETLVAYGSIKKNGLLSKILYMGEYLLYRKVSAMIFTMEGCKQYISEHNWDKDSGGKIDFKNIYHLNNGVDINQFDMNLNQFPLNDEEINSRNKFKIVYTGAIRKANNLGIIIEVAKLLSEFKNILFIIYGDGDQLNELQKRTKDEKVNNIVFKGKVEKKYIPYIVSNSTINLFHWKMSSVNKYGYDYNKMFDYLAAGKPILSTVQSGYSFLIKNNCGIETVGSSAKEISDGILHFYNMSEKEMKILGKNARKLSYEFDMPKLSIELSKIIENVNC